jgi:endogenous inhibitor of DNA gyrase (YacG/DUF329 family)
MCECPHCGKEFQWEDYYLVEVGSTTECPKCKKTVHVRFIDWTVNVELSTEAED